MCGVTNWTIKEDMNYEAYNVWRNKLSYQGRYEANNVWRNELSNQGRYEAKNLPAASGPHMKCLNQHLSQNHYLTRIILRIRLSGWGILWIRVRESHPRSVLSVNHTYFSKSEMWLTRKVCCLSSLWPLNFFTASTADCASLYSMKTYLKEGNTDWTKLRTEIQHGGLERELMSWWSVEEVCVPFRGALLVGREVVPHDGSARCEKVANDGLELGETASLDLGDPVNDYDVVHAIRLGRTLPQKIAEQLCTTRI